MYVQFVPTTQIRKFLICVVGTNLSISQIRIFLIVVLGTITRIRKFLICVVDTNCTFKTQIRNFLSVVISTICTNKTRIRNFLILVRAIMLNKHIQIPLKRCSVIFLFSWLWRFHSRQQWTTNIQSTIIVVILFYNLLTIYFVLSIFLCAQFLGFNL